MSRYNLFEPSPQERRNSLITASAPIAWPGHDASELDDAVLSVDRASYSVEADMLRYSEIREYDHSEERDDDGAAFTSESSTLFKEDSISERSGCTGSSGCDEELASLFTTPPSSSSSKIHSPCLQSDVSESTTLPYRARTPTQRSRPFIDLATGLDGQRSLLASPSCPSTPASESRRSSVSSSRSSPSLSFDDFKEHDVVAELQAHALKSKGAVKNRSNILIRKGNIIMDYSHTNGEEVLEDFVSANIANSRIPLTICNDKTGTVRGVRNRVRQRVEHFVDTSNMEHWNADTKEATTHGEGSVIVYSTSLGFVRKTHADCLYVKQIFRGLMLKTEIRDVVNQHHKTDFEARFPGMTVPQIIVDGKHIGGRQELEYLVETGKIGEVARNVERSIYTSEPCRKCGDYRYLNCPNCLGSGKSHRTRIGNTRELTHLKCSHCREGLVQCTECLGNVG